MNPLLTSPVELAFAPSTKDGLSPEEESWSRLKAALFIQKIAYALNLPVQTVNLAKLYMHKFYLKNSFNKIKYQEVSGASLLLAMKATNQIYKRFGILILHLARKSLKNEELVLNDTSEIFLVWKRIILFYEGVVVEELGFDLDLQHLLPHKTALEYIKHFKGSHALAQLAFTLCNNCVDTTIPLRYSKKTCAAICIYTAAQSLDEKINFIPQSQNNPSKKIPWWEYMKVNEKLLSAVSEELVVTTDEILHKKFSQKRAIHASALKDLMRGGVRGNERVSSSSSLSFSPNYQSSPNYGSTPKTPAQASDDGDLLKSYQTNQNKIC